MQNRKIDLNERLLQFAVEIIKFTHKLDKTYTGRHIAGQLMRAATSAGANWEETCGTESRADFIHKLQIVLKELRESLYWLRLIQRANLITDFEQCHSSLPGEAKELANIVAKSVLTAKRK